MVVVFEPCVNDEEQGAGGDFAECDVSFLVFGVLCVVLRERIWIVEGEDRGIEVDSVLEEVGPAFLFVVLESHDGRAAPVHTLVHTVELVDGVGVTSQRDCEVRRLVESASKYKEF